MKRRTGPGERQRRFRLRQKRGEVVAPVPVNHDVVGALIETGWLAEADSRNREMVGYAVSRMLLDVALANRSKIPLRVDIHAASVMRLYLHEKARSPGPVCPRSS